MEATTQTTTKEYGNKKPVFAHSSLLYTLSAILTVPLLIDMCTACHLFSLWLAWLLFTLIGAISLIRLFFAFKQKCYKFAWCLLGQLALGAAVLTFFQLSYTNVIETPVSHPVTPAVVNIAPPVIEHDSVKRDSVYHPAMEDIKDKEEKMKEEEYNKEKQLIKQKELRELERFREMERYREEEH